MAPHLDTGLRGEQLALDYLLAQGMTLVRRRWRHRNTDELDLILLDPTPQGRSAGGELVIVEVKTLTGAGPRRPEDGLTPAKQRALRRAAEAYCALEPPQRPVRFDVVAVTLSPGGDESQIEHFRDVRLA